MINPVIRNQFILDCIHAQVSVASSLFQHCQEVYQRCRSKTQANPGQNVALSAQPLEQKEALPAESLNSPCLLGHPVRQGPVTLFHGITYNSIEKLNSIIECGFLFPGYRTIDRKTFLPQDDDVTLFQYHAAHCTYHIGEIDFHKDDPSYPSLSSLIEYHDPKRSWTNWFFGKANRGYGDISLQFVLTTENLRTLEKDNGGGISLYRSYDAYTMPQPLPLTYATKVIIRIGSAYNTKETISTIRQMLDAHNFKHIQIEAIRIEQEGYSD